MICRSHRVRARVPTKPIDSAKGMTAWPRPESACCVTTCPPGRLSFSGPGRRIGRSGAFGTAPGRSGPTKGWGARLHLPRSKGRADADEPCAVRSAVCAEEGLQNSPGGCVPASVKRVSRLVRVLKGKRRLGSGRGAILSGEGGAAGGAGSRRARWLGLVAGFHDPARWVRRSTSAVARDGAKCKRGGLASNKRLPDAPY